MSLNDRILEDIDRVFLNVEQFATEHLWEKTTILCVLDDEEALKRKNNNVVDIAWDNTTVDVMVYAKESEFPKRPIPQQTVLFDRYQWTVQQVGDNMGMLAVLLSRKASKAVTT